MTDKEILDKYINVDNSCLNKEEKKEVMDMLYRYKEAFSLRDEIGTFLNLKWRSMLQISHHFYKTISCEGG